MSKEREKFERQISQSLLDHKPIAFEEKKIILSHKNSSVDRGVANLMTDMRVVKVNRYLSRDKRVSQSP